MELFLIRHGQTEWSVSGQHTGMTDLPLTDEGRRQSASAGPIISRLLEGRQFAAIYSSPLQRARDTAALALGVSAVPVICDELREYQYGELEGLTPQQIRERIPGWDIWRDGCPGGETTEEVGARADAFLERCNDVTEPVAAFSHGHMIRILGARALGLAASDGQLFTLSTAATCVIKDYHGKRCIAAWNWTGDDA